MFSGWPHAAGLLLCTAALAGAHTDQIFLAELRPALGFCLRPYGLRCLAGLRVASMHASRGRRTRRLRFVVTQTILRSREVSEEHTANVSGARLRHFLLRGTVGTDLKRPWLARPEMKMRVSRGIRKTRISEGTDLVEID